MAELQPAKKGRELTAEWFIRTFDGAIARWQWGAPSLGDAVRPF